MRNRSASTEGTTVRVVLAQISTTVGDIEGNLRHAIRAVERAENAGAQITLLPEMTLTGYPPEDLVYKDHFVERNLTALAEFAGYCTGPAVVGFVDRDPETGDLHNAAALVGSQRVLDVYHKRRLPNYGVFDERRYFGPGAEPVLVELAGASAALTVCEDIWVPELAEESSLLGARLLLNISASPFHAGKGRSREDMLAERAKANGIWVAYCNLVGAQDELVFDGRSVVIDPSGRVVARGRAFDEDLVIADIDPVSGKGAGPLSDEVRGPEEVYRAIQLGLRDYVVKNGFSDVVLGLSGGIDSALTAAIAVDALGPERVHCVMMPSRYSSAGSVSDSEELAAVLGCDLRSIPIEGPQQAFLDALAPSFEGTQPDVTEENLQARVRGVFLMALSNKFGWLTLATGNKSELSVGYSTLYGDMVGGFAPIKDVFKMRVYELARWRNMRPGGPVIPQAIMDKAPSAELRPDQVDQDSLPPYEVLDSILQRYVEEDAGIEDIVAGGYDRATVERVVRMTDVAEYKRRQGPLGVKITPKAFGKDRRMPVTNRFGR